MGSRLRTALAATLLAATASTAAMADPQGINQFGTERDDQAFGVAVGSDGRVHVVGRTDGLDFPADPRDALVVTFDRDGRELWQHQPGTTGDDRANAVATDADGNVYVVGYAGGALAGAGGGPNGAFLMKLDPDGHTLWTRQPATTGYGTATGVATDAGDVYMAGYTTGSIGGANKGGFDAFVIKFDRDGGIVWKRQPGTPAGEMANAVATDADGNVYVVGSTGGAFGGAHRGQSDAFVLKFDRNGRALWRRQPGTPGEDEAFGVATDADGNVYVVGWTSGALGGPNKYGGSDAFLIKFGRDGRILWRRQPGTSRWDDARGVATDASGNVHVVGLTAGPLGGAFAGGYDDAFVISFDRDGRILRSNQPATSATDLASGVATDGDGNAYVAGLTYGSLPGNANLGRADAFLITYGPNEPQ